MNMRIVLEAVMMRLDGEFTYACEPACLLEDFEKESYLGNHQCAHFTPI